VQHSELTHFNDQGRARMVDVSGKESTARTATACAKITMHPDTLKAIRNGQMKKGDVLAVAQIAGIMAAKNTFELIPMCHPIPLSSVDIHFEEILEANTIDIYATIKTTYVTGVEMEALTAATVTALTIYDMCKSMDKDMRITDICLLEKTGGKSGNYFRKEQPKTI
jgi:cyclic pyranopterin phosphate synthase